MDGNGKILLFRPRGWTRDADEPPSAEDWYVTGLLLESVAAAEAAEAYQRAVYIDPRHAASHARLGALLHAGGRTRAAEFHYRLALAADPADDLTADNLALAIEDQRR